MRPIFALFVAAALCVGCVTHHEYAGGTERYGDRSGTGYDTGPGAQGVDLAIPGPERDELLQTLPPATPPPLGTPLPNSPAPVLPEPVPEEPPIVPPEPLPPPVIPPAPEPPPVEDIIP